MRAAQELDGVERAPPKTGEPQMETESALYMGPATVSPVMKSMLPQALGRVP